MAELDKIPPVSAAHLQFSFSYSVSLRQLKSTWKTASYLDISEDKKVKQERTMLWWSGCSWLADRGQRETKLILQGSDSGVEIKLQIMSSKHYHLSWGSYFIGRGSKSIWNQFKATTLSSLSHLTQPVIQHLPYPPSLFWPCISEDLEAVWKEMFPNQTSSPQELNK